MLLSLCYYHSYLVMLQKISIRSNFFLKDTTWIVRKELTLSGSNIAATMTVSVLFYPIKSVQQVVNSRRSSLIPTTLDDEPKIKRNSLPWMQQAVRYKVLHLFGKNFYVNVTQVKILSEAAINAQGRWSCLLRYIQSSIHWKRFDGSDVVTRKGSRCEGSERFQRSFLRIETEQWNEI